MARTGPTPATLQGRHGGFRILDFGFRISSSPTRDFSIGVIRLPVEPVLFEERDALQRAPRERAADRRAGKIPLAAGVRVEHPERRCAFLREQLKRLAVHASIE